MKKCAMKMKERKKEGKNDCRVKIFVVTGSIDTRERMRSLVSMQEGIYKAVSEEWPNRCLLY